MHLEDDLLCATASRVIGALSEARRVSAAAYFVAGDGVHRLRLSTAHGSRPVARLADAVGIHESGLQRIARMAEAIREPERSAMLDLVDKRGFPLSSSHFEELALASRRADRLRLARAALDQGLSVRALRDLRLCACSDCWSPSPKAIASCEPR